METNFLNFQGQIFNFCFVILFLTTIYYWLKIIFLFENSKQNLFLTESFSLSLSPKDNFRKLEKIIQSGQIGFFGLSCVEILLTFQLIIRWIDSGHFPLSGLYESLLFLSWGLIFFYLILEFNIETEVVGFLISPIILLILGFSEFSLPTELQQAKPLVPALQSNWLLMHVTVMMFSYAGLLLGSLISIGFLILFYTQKNNIFNNMLLSKQNNTGDKNLNNKSRIQDLTSNFTFQENDNLPSSQNQEQLFEMQSDNNKTLLILFDNLSYRTIGIGFCFLTLGILSGAVWANETWGSYWSWDPKETWAFITWIVFAVYLHTRFLKGWTGFKPATIASFGFVVIWICYLGVNFLGKGLHSYGFLSS